MTNQPTIGSHDDIPNTAVNRAEFGTRSRSRRSRSRIRRGSRSGRRGAVTVEFALTAPILLLLFFASIEFGRAHMIRHALQNAVYEGARTALVPNTSDIAVRESTRRVMNATGVREVTIIVNQREENVTVAAQVPFDEESWISPFFCSGMMLSSSITLTRDAG